MDVNSRQVQVHLDKLNATIRLKQLLLDSVLEMTMAINSNFPTDHLFKIYEFILRSQLNIGKMALFSLDTEWQCKLIYGVDQDFLSDGFDIQKEILNKISKDIAVIDKNSSSFSEALNGFDVIIPVFHKERALAFVMIGGFNIEKYDVEQDIIFYIQTITNIIIVAIENKKLARDRIKREGMKKELELAAQMQSMLFPTSLLQNKEMDMKATYLPHQDIGGDYYDYILLNENEFIMCIADVSGKGMAAALLMANFQASLHALLNYNTHLPDLLKQLNTNVNENAKNEKFVTFFICKFNLLTNEITYINAGHNPPVLYYDNKVILLDEGTTGLGMFEELPFIHEKKIKIKKGSLLCLYTDGIVEQENDSEIPFGIERLSDFVIKNANMTSRSEFHEKLINYIIAFKQNQSFSDDITLFSCRM